MGNTGESVLANNSDLSTDGGQAVRHARIHELTFRTHYFVRAHGLGHEQVRQQDAAFALIIFPGGQQYGEISLSRQRAAI